MHDSAVAIVQPRERSSPATCSSTVEPSVENSVSAWRSRTTASNASVGRLGRRLVPGHHLELPAAQARRDLQPVEPRARGLGRPQRLGDLGLRDAVQAQRVLRDTWSRPRSPRANVSAAAAAGHISCSSRGGPGSTTTVGPPFADAGGTTRPGRRPDRIEDRRALRHDRLLAVGRADAPPDRGPASARGSGRGSRRCAPRARRRGPSRRPWKAPTTSAVRSSAVGPSPPLVTIRSTPIEARNASARVHVLGPVADDDGVGVVDPELAQAVATATARCGRDTRPDSTSVPVTTMPARARSCAAGRAAARPAAAARAPGGVIS